MAYAGFSYLGAMIFASVFISYNADISVYITVALMIIFVLSVVLKKPIPAVISIFAAIGTAAFTISFCALTAQLSFADGNIYNIDAVVNEKCELGNDLSNYILECGSWLGRVKFILTSDDIDVTVGDRISCSVKFEPIKSGAFSSDSYYLSRGITLRAMPRSSLTYTKSDKNFLSVILSYRDYLSDIIGRNCPDEGGALMKGIFLGDKSDISYIDRYNIKAAGAAHLTAVSGMHMTMLIHILNALLMLLGIGRLPRTRITLTLAATVLMMIFFGLKGSVMRAGIMLIIHYGGELFFRKSSCLNSIGAAVLIILTADPLAALDAGLVFSAVTTIGAGAAAPALAKQIKKKITRGENVIDAVCCSVCAALFAVPLSAVYFNMLPLYGIFVSLACIPFFTVSLVFLLLFALSGGMLEVLLTPAHICCTIMDRIFSFAAALPCSHFAVNDTVKLTITAAAGIVLLAYAVFKKHRIITVAAGSASAAIITSLVMNITNDTDAVRVLPYSDGENGCVLIISKECSGAVIIGGGDRAAQLLYSAVLSNNIRRLDFLQLASDEENSIGAYKDIFTDMADVILSENERYYEFLGYADTIVADNDVLYANFYGVDICAAKSAVDGYIPDIGIYSDKGEYGADIEMYFDKDCTDGINLYYNETVINIYPDGTTRITKGGDLYDDR